MTTLQPALTIVDCLSGSMAFMSQTKHDRELAGTIQNFDMRLILGES